MKNKLIILFLIIFISGSNKAQNMVYDIKNTIYYKNNSDINFISKLYPNKKYINKENRDAWYIYSDSITRFIYQNNEYIIITWNEINNPSAQTQTEHYNYGGVIILSKGEIIYKKLLANQTIERIIQTKNKTFIIFREVIANHGYEKNNLNIAKFENNSLKFLKSIKIKDSDLWASGTYYKEADIIYSDLKDNDQLNIKVDLYDYIIVNSEKSNDKKLIQTINIILE